MTVHHLRTYVIDADPLLHRESDIVLPADEHIVTVETMMLPHGAGNRPGYRIITVRAEDE